MSKEKVTVTQVKRMAVDMFAAKMASKGLTVDGREIPNPIPMEPPVGFEKRPSIFDTQREMMKAHAARVAAYEEMNDDEEDFEIEDDPFPMSGFEYNPEDQARIEEYVAQYNARVEEAKALAAEKARGDKFRASERSEDGPPKAGTDALEQPSPPPSKGAARRAREALDGER